MKVKELFTKIKFSPDDRIRIDDNPNLTFISIPATTDALNFKPKGFWYAIGRSWLDWLEGERMNWWKKYIYKIEINPQHILLLDTEKKIREFSKEYTLPDMGLFGMVDWRRVGEKYTGVEFNPYFHGSVRYELMFYNGIDVASGCIWDKKGLRSIKRLN
jgi:hypothetical protein